MQAQDKDKRSGIAGSWSDRCDAATARQQQGSAALCLCREYVTTDD